MEIENLNSITTQYFQYKFEDNSIAYFTLKYADNLQQWFLDLQVGDFLLFNVSLVRSDNILNQYRNILNFAIAIDTKNGLNPFGRNCWANKEATFYIVPFSMLTEEE